jgi:hypothetical protein
MQNMNLFFRRTHLYLGMIMLPWMVMYAVSTIYYNHGISGHHGARQAGAEWVQLWEKDYSTEIPSTDPELRTVARRILDENGFTGAFGVLRQGQRLTINVPRFLKPSRVIYDATQKKLRAETRSETSTTEVMARLHTRTGYGRGGGFLNILWAVTVDVFCVTTFLWIGTGLYLWWKLPMTRRWGFVAMGSGVATIAVLLMTL